MSNKPKLVSNGGAWLSIELGGRVVGRVWQHAKTHEWRASIGSYDGPPCLTPVAAFKAITGGLERVAPKLRRTIPATRQRERPRAIENTRRTDFTPALARRLDRLVGNALRARE